MLRNICGGKIDMLVKRGSLGTGVCLTAEPNPNARVVTTNWENWTTPVVGRNGIVRRISRLGIKNLDQFLMGTEK